MMEVRVITAVYASTSVSDLIRSAYNPRSVGPLIAKRAALMGGPHASAIRSAIGPPMRAALRLSPVLRTEQHHHAMLPGPLGLSIQR